MTAPARPDRPITAADVMSADEVAELVRTHPRTIYRWAYAGTIPSRQRGRRVLFLRWEIEAWLIGDARGASPPP